MSSRLRPRRKKSGPPDDNLEVVFIGEDLGLAELYRLKLELDGYWVTVFPTIDEGLEHIRTRMPDLVFVDLGPNSTRKSEGLGPLRSDARFLEVPIVLLARGDIQTAEPESLQLGGRDFLVRVDAVPGEDFWKDATDGPQGQTL